MFSEKMGLWTVIKVFAGIGKTPTETHKILKLSENHRNVRCSLVFKGYTRFSDGKENEWMMCRIEDHHFWNAEPCQKSSWRYCWWSATNSARISRQMLNFKDYVTWHFISIFIYELCLCTQDFKTFDYWKFEKESRIV